MTHGIGFLPQCDVIVVMADGQITEVGSYTELIDNDGPFAQFLHGYQTAEANGDQVEDPGNDFGLNNLLIGELHVIRSKLCWCMKCFIFWFNIPYSMEIFEE